MVEGSLAHTLFPEPPAGHDKRVIQRNERALASRRATRVCAERVLVGFTNEV
jgi:hypothetical protein